MTAFTIVEAVIVIFYVFEKACIKAALAAFFTFNSKK